jgi:uncharacterized protein YfaS (alpha-2-macroglobulin family)
VTGKPVVALTAPSGVNVPAPGAAWEATALGKGPLVFTNTGDAPAFVALSTQGWRKPGVKEASHGLIVTRQFLTQEGKAADLAHLRPGDLVVLETTVKLAPDAGCNAATRLALTVDLPGGLTPENARLATASAVAKEEGASLRQEAGDGRMVVFGSVSRDQYGDQPQDHPMVSRLVLRVTAKGRFTLGPAQASDMDDPTLSGVDAGGAVLESQ